MIVSGAVPGLPPGLSKSKQISDGLERAFLSDMLKYAGPKPMEGAFGGGIGEEQFSSMMVETYADALSRKLDLGISAKIGGSK